MERPSKRLKRQNDKEPGFYAEVDSDDESDEKLDLLKPVSITLFHKEMAISCSCLSKYES